VLAHSLIHDLLRIKVSKKHALEDNRPCIKILNATGILPNEGAGYYISYLPVMPIECRNIENSGGVLSEKSDIELQNAGR
jgi:hypothetical protein